MFEHLFDCAVCLRPVHDYRDRRNRDRVLEPLCRFCEGDFSERPPQYGAFMDRRRAVQVSALANALLSRASIMNWERRYGRP